VVQEEVEKSKNDREVQYKDSQYDLQYELKLQWEDLIRQHPHPATGKVSKTTTTILPAEDFKLQWEELRQKRLILLPETSESASPPNVEPSGTSTAQTVATSTERMANPGAFSIPGSRWQSSQVSVEQQYNDPLDLVQAAEVSGDHEHQLELQLEALQRQRNALVRTLQNIGRADVIPDHIRKSADLSSTGRKREKVWVSAGVFATVIGLGVILLLVVLLMMHDPGTITRFNMIELFNITMKYNITVKEKQNYHTLLPSANPQAPTQVPPDAHVPSRSNANSIHSANQNSLVGTEHI